MRRAAVHLALALALVASGIALLATLLDDATLVVRWLGLEPAGNEAKLVIVGMAAAAATLAVGIRRLLGPLRLDTR
jgi:hypothetical protein